MLIGEAHDRPVFQLRLLWSFPREILYVSPPVPASPDSPNTPAVSTSIGEVLFYFSEWETSGSLVMAFAFFAEPGVEWLVSFKIS